MKLEEAIGLCKCAAEDMDLQEMPRFAQAVRLGREALKAHKRRREDPKGNWSYLLPGETQEDA